MNNEEKKQCFIKKMIEAWSLLLEESEDTGKKDKSTEKLCNIDIEAVRKILLVKAQEGKSAEIREILQSFHVEKLSDLDESYYGELIQRAKRI